MFSLLYSVFFRHARPLFRRWLCVAGSMLGVFLVICFSPTAENGLGTLWGNLFIVAAALCWVCLLYTSRCV